MTFYIYQIINTINGKIYIGQTNDIKRRLKEHIKDANDNKRSSKPLYKAIKKYGVNIFDFRIIQEVNSFQESLDCERYWIKYYQTNIIRYGEKFGYNLSDGGDGGGNGPKSQTHKKNIGKSNKGKTRTKLMRLKLSKSKSNFSNDQLSEIKNLLINNVSEYSIAKKFAVCQSIISDIKLGISHRYFFTDEDITNFSTRTRDLNGEKNGASKLKEHQVIEIKLLLKTNTPIKTIAKLYGIGKTSVRRILHGETWSYLNIP